MPSPSMERLDRLVRSGGCRGEDLLISRETFQWMWDTAPACGAGGAVDGS